MKQFYTQMWALVILSRWEKDSSSIVMLMDWIAWSTDIIFFNSSVFINTAFKIPPGLPLWLHDQFKGFKMVGTGQSDPLAVEDVVGKEHETRFAPSRAFCTIRNLCHASWCATLGCKCRFHACLKHMWFSKKAEISSVSCVLKNSIKHLISFNNPQ